MTIRVNGETLIRNVTVRLNEDGKILTVIARNPDRTAGDVTAQLDGTPKIEVMDGGAVKAVYQGMKLITSRMETLGGVLTITASLQVDTLDMDTADALRQELAAQAKVVAELGGVIKGQAQVIGTQAGRIAAQEKTINETLKTTQGAASAIKALQEENEQLKEALELLLAGTTEGEEVADGESVEDENSGV